MNQELPGNTSDTEVAPVVSVIIIANRPSAYLRQALAAIARLDEPAWEVVGVLDEPFASDDRRFRFLASGPVGPAQKRDLAASQARGAILAFLDDDAYPAKAWLTAALRRFDDPTVWAVGGPGVTPPDDGFWQQMSGWVYASRLVAGPARHRYVREPAREVDDYPSMNLLVRKSVFNEVGGFNSEFYPGEDTKLCLEITRRGGRIVYEPDALVYHHRRSLLHGHFGQITAYARHRGYFARRFPETSRRLPYFVPSLWVAWLLLGWPVGRRLAGVRALYRASLRIYALAVGLAAAEAATQARSPATGIVAAPAIAATHLVYGVAFVLGLLGRRR